MPSHVILDLNLPDGHGTSVLRHIRTNTLPAKVAILSGSADEGLLTAAADLRPDAFFKKPPNWDAVTTWVSD